MPTATTSKSVKRAPRATKSAVAVHNHAPMPSAAICRACNALPMRSSEMLSLLLVLVFSLSAVLFTTVAALNIEKAKVSALRQALVALDDSTYVAPVITEQPSAPAEDAAGIEEAAADDVAPAADAPVEEAASVTP